MNRVKEGIKRVKIRKEKKEEKREKKMRKEIHKRVEKSSTKLQGGHGPLWSGASVKNLELVGSMKWSCVTGVCLNLLMINESKQLSC